MCIARNQQKPSVFANTLCYKKIILKEPPVYVYIFKNMKVLILFYKNYKKKTNTCTNHVF